MSKKIVFVWDNFGPIHSDRASAVATSFKNERVVVGIELNSVSDTYDWDVEQGNGYKKWTIAKKRNKSKVNRLFDWIKLIGVLLRNRGADYFFCHYERPSIFFAAVVLRLLMQRVFIMNDSKFDDYERKLSKEILKSIMYSPYLGGIASGVRSKDYMRFLGVPAKSIYSNYNSMSLSRIRSLSLKVGEGRSTDYSERHFTVVARLVEKKNLFRTIDAYVLYTKSVAAPRRLKIAGNGPLEADLRKHAVDSGVGGLVDFLGFIQAPEVAQLLTSTLVLLLLSTEEQFGNVVIEALAVGLPCIVSTACGARDELVCSGVNGFIVEPDNVYGSAYFMSLIGNDIDLWRRMCEKSNERAEMGDVSRFVNAVQNLVAK